MSDAPWRDEMEEPGQVHELGGKYYGTYVSVGHADVRIWCHLEHTRPSDREIADWGYDSWEAVPEEVKSDMLVDSHYETQADYEVACLVAAAPELRQLVREMVAHLASSTLLSAEWVRRAQRVLRKAEGR